MPNVFKKWIKDNIEKERDAYSIDTKPFNIKNDKEYNQVELKDLDNLFSLSSISGLNVQATKAIINESGMWPLIRQRPFSKVANIESKPKSIFVSMSPTDPLALDQLFLLNGQS